MPNPNGGLFPTSSVLILSQIYGFCQPDFLPNPKDRFPKTKKLNNGET